MNAQKSGPLTQDELRRYSRHLVLPGVGPEGQVKLRGASALVIGAGGLGSPAALYLAAAGVGRIGLVDFDVVDSSNLQRQIIHSSSDVGRAKIASASESLMGLNPLIRVETHEVRLTSKNALKIVSEYDIVLTARVISRQGTLSTMPAFFPVNPMFPEVSSSTTVR